MPRSTAANRARHLLSPGRLNAKHAQGRRPLVYGAGRAATQGDAELHMTIVLETYSRLIAIDELLALMLKQPCTHHAKMIIERITALVEYVDHVYTVMWRQQERGALSVFDARFTLPVVSEIWLQVKQELNVHSRSLCELAGSITGLISLVSFYLSRIEGNNDTNRVLH